MTAGGAGQQQKAVAEPDPADVDGSAKTLAETFERQDQDANAVQDDVSSRGGGSRGGGSRGGGSRGGGVAGVRSGGEEGEGGAAGELEDEAAVGSIHHILKTAFKELYGGGADGKEEEQEQASVAEVAGKRQGESAGAAGSEAGRRSSSSTVGTTSAEGEGSNGSGSGRDCCLDSFVSGC